MQRIKFTIATGVLVIGAITAMLALTEKILVSRLVPRNFEYLQLRPKANPNYALVRFFHNPIYTISEGRRELLGRGQRNYRVAFIGDSVTFGLGVPDGENFVEKLQQAQAEFDAYNYGVPGYGLPQISAAAEQLNPLELRRVVYTLNYNDIYSAMPGLLGLIDEPELFADTHGYQGWERTGKLFLKEHFKTYFILSQWLKAWRSPAQAPSGRAHNAPLTVEEIERMARGSNFEQYAANARRFFSNPAAVNQFVQNLATLKQKIHSRGSQLWVTTFFDYLLVNDEALRATMQEALASAGITYLNLHPLYTAHAQETGFYADPGHLGPLGHQLVANALQEALAKDTSSRLAFRH